MRRRCSSQCASPQSDGGAAGACRPAGGTGLLPDVPDGWFRYRWPVRPAAGGWRSGGGTTPPLWVGGFDPPARGFKEAWWGRPLPVLLGGPWGGGRRPVIKFLSFFNSEQHSGLKTFPSLIWALGSFKILRLIKSRNAS